MRVRVLWLGEVGCYLRWWVSSKYWLFVTSQRVNIHNCVLAHTHKGEQANEIKSWTVLMRHNCVRRHRAQYGCYLKKHITHVTGCRLLLKPPVTSCWFRKRTDHRKWSQRCSTNNISTRLSDSRVCTWPSSCSHHLGPALRDPEETRGTSACLI